MDALCCTRSKRNVNKKVQLDATICRHLFTAKSLYMFRASQHPPSGALKTVTATSGIGHNTGTSTSFQRGLLRSQHPPSGAIRTVTATSGIGHNTSTSTSFQRGLLRSQHPPSGALKTVTATSGIGHNTGTSTSFQRGRLSPEPTTLEGSRCTSIMTYTRGSGYSI